MAYRVQCMVVPTHLHKDTSGRKLEASKRFHIAPVNEAYALHTAPKSHREGRRFFGTIFSVGETSVAWLLAEGYRTFMTLGIDPEGGYSPLFAGGPQVAKPKKHFKINWQRIKDRVEAAGGSIHRID